MIYFRICIITLLRVTYIARMNLLDFSYASVDLAIWSILEPTLGILNASLPVLRPVGSHIFESHALTWARNSFRSLLTQISTRGGTENSGSGRSWPRLSKKSTRDSFLRLGDPTDRLYPLDTINLGGSAEGQELETHREHSGKNDSQPFNAWGWEWVIHGHSYSLKVIPFARMRAIDVGSTFYYDRRLDANW